MRLVDHLPQEPNTWHSNFGFYQKKTRLVENPYFWAAVRIAGYTPVISTICALVKAFVLSFAVILGGRRADSKMTTTEKKDISIAFLRYGVEFFCLGWVFILPDIAMTIYQSCEFSKPQIF